MNVIGPRRALLAPPIDPDALRWRAAVIAAGGPVSDAQKRRVSTLIRSLKASGIWPTLDRLWLFAAENPTQAGIDLVARASVTLVASPVFTAGRGHKGNGTSSYINLGFNASTAAGKYAQNDAMMATWVETAQSDASRVDYIGNDFNNYGLIGQNNGTTAEFGINSVTSLTSALGTKTGLWHLQRTASNAVAVYQNATVVASNSAVSAAIANANFAALATMQTVTPTNFTNGRVSMSAIGRSMPAGQVGAFYSSMRTYMTAVGVA